MLLVQQQKHDYSILIGGQAGQGSRKAGLVIAEFFNHLGFKIYIYNDYPSLIRGGHNYSHIRASQNKINAHSKKIDYLLALDTDTLEKHHKNVESSGVIIYNQDQIKSETLDQLQLQATNQEKHKLTLIGLSLKDFTPTAPAIMANTLLLAALAKVIGLKLEILEKIIKTEIEAKTAENLELAKKTYQQVETQTTIQPLIKDGKSPNKLVTGNATLAMGAAQAGLDLYLAYPMTPATGILHYLAQNHDLGVKAIQLENELGVANAAVGAAYAGAKTMVGSSGGGFALMVEALSLTVQNETPLVFVESQRAGPASGVPTYTQQSDLSFVLSAGHGDITKFVIAPGDADETYQWSGKALELAWKYQTPVILLIDKQISESTYSFDQSSQKKIKPVNFEAWKQDESYLRYKQTETGVSPLAFPGEKDAVVKANSYEHDEAGLTIEKADQVVAMQDKRAKKFTQMKHELKNLEAVKTYGTKNAKKAIITWGSNKGAVIEAAKELELRVIQLIVMEPFPKKQLETALKGVEKSVIVELNQQAQLGKLLHQNGFEVDQKILKYDGRPFLTMELQQALKDF